MKRYFLYIFLLIFIMGFLVWPKIGLAENSSDDIVNNQDKIELKEKDAKLIIKSLTQELSDKKSGLPNIEEQAVLVILQQAVKRDIAHYLFIDVPKKVGKSVINATIKLGYSILAQDPSIIIKEIEKLSVEKAKEYAMDWLLQKEIKTSSGNLEVSYSTYKGDWQKVIFPYNIIYHPLDVSHVEIGIEIYSSKLIKTPYPTGAYQWEGGIEELRPFIVRISGKVEKVWVGLGFYYDWIEGAEIDVVFDEPVPEFEFEEQGFLGKKVAEYKSDINKIEKALENFLVIFGKSGQVVKDKVKVILDKIGTVFSWFDLFGAKISPDLGFFEQEGVGQIGQEEEEIEETEEIKEKEIIEQGTGGPEGLTLNEAQEILDDIAERIDILSQKVTELVGESEGIGGPIEPIEELEEEETEDFEEKEDTEEKERGICTVNINTASKEELEKIIGVGSVIAQKIIEARPFSSIYDLIRVSGIGEITLQKIVNQGCAYVEYHTGGGGGGGGSGKLPTYSKILISEIQTESQTAKDEFIELYNPNSQSVDLTGWALKKKTSGGNESNLVSSAKFSGIISSGSYFLIVPQPNDDDSPNYQGLAAPNLYYSGKTYSIAGSNTILLYNPNDNLVDKVGFGFAQDFETAPAENPPPGKSIGRKWVDGGYQDIDNNSLDFEIKAVLAAPEPELEPDQNIIETATPSISPTIYINEIAWMGTEASSNDEWIELYNPNPEPIELLDWQLLFYPKEQTEPRITTFSFIDTATPSIAGFSYFLLERTSDDTISDIKADYIFKGALNDDGGVLELRDANSNLINRVDCSKEKWFAGDKDKKISMERIDADNWASNNLIIRQGFDVDNNKIWGTPRAKNSVSQSPTEIISPLPFDKFDKLTLTLLNTPFIIKGTLEIPENKTLIIEPGVIIKFYDKYSGIKIGGTLKATDATFTSFQDNPQPGAWDKLYFTETSTDSELDNVIVEYAGGGYGTPCNPDMAGVKVEQSSITLKNSVIKNNQYRGTHLIDSESLIDNSQFLNNIACSSGYGNEYGGVGLEIGGGSSKIKNSIFQENPIGISINNKALPEIENNIFEKNKKAVWFTDSYPSFKNNQAIDNEFNGVLVYGSLSQNANWQADLAYIIEGTLTVFPNTVLVIESGAVVKFYDKYSGLAVEGTLKANGVVFTSFSENPQPGSWDKLYFTETSTNSELDNVIVQYAGGGYGTPCSPDMAGIRVEKSSITLKNSVIEHNQYRGIYLIESDSIIDNVQIIDSPVCCKGCHNEYGGVGLEVYNGNSVLENLTFEANKCNISRDSQCVDPAP